MQRQLQRALRPTLSSLLCCRSGCSTVRGRRQLQSGHIQPCSDCQAATFVPPPPTRRTAQSVSPPPEPAAPLHSPAGGSQRSPSSRHRRAQPAVGSGTPARGEALAASRVQTLLGAVRSNTERLKMCSLPARRRQIQHLMRTVLRLTLPSPVRCAATQTGQQSEGGEAPRGLSGGECSPHLPKANEPASERTTDITALKEQLAMMTNERNAAIAAEVEARNTASVQARCCLFPVARRCSRESHMLAHRPACLHAALRCAVGKVEKARLASGARDEACRTFGAASRAAGAQGGAEARERSAPGCCRCIGARGLRRGQATGKHRLSYFRCDIQGSCRGPPGVRISGTCLAELTTQDRSHGTDELSS